MVEHTSEPEPRIQHIDADAVCAECGTVNPEDTLLCKTCGNNLRDQRLRRVAEGRGFEEFAEVGGRRQWIVGGLTVLGLIVVVWVGVNVSAIEDWLVDIQTGAVATARSYWSEGNTAVYDDLLRELEVNPITRSDVDQVMQSGLASNGLDGRYFLKAGDGADDKVIGQANVLRKGTIVYFVAELFSGVEVRGAAQLRERDRPEVESAAVRIGDELIIGYGFAQRNSDGSFTCYGQSDASEESIYTVLAYRVP